MTDFIIGWLKKEGLPVTRENYMAINYWGAPPREIDPEAEDEMEEALAAEFVRQVGIRVDEVEEEED